MGFAKKTRKGNTVAICIGIVYLWFGLLKFFPGISPAESLAKDTIDQLTFGLIPPNISIVTLAIWETLIGLLFIANYFNRFVIFAALVHITLTFTPFFFFPELTLTEVPFGLTLLGQYIIKNIVIVAMLGILYRKNKKSFSL